MAHWHDFNPWAAELCYIPSLEEAAALVYEKSDRIADLVSHWKQSGGNKLDAYILSQPSGWRALGIRFGKEPEQYFSYDCDKERAAILLEKLQLPGAP